MKRRLPPPPNLPTCPYLPGTAAPNLLIFTVYIILALVLSYPLLFNLTTTVPNDIGDPLLNTWILAWDSHALLTDPLNLFNANIFHPLPNSLAFSEHLFSTAILALPLQLFLAEPILVYNLSLLATFPLAAFGMYLLTLRWTGRHSAAFVGGFIFAFSPYRFAAIAHLQLLTFQWLPFALLFFDKILVHGPTSEGEKLRLGEPFATTAGKLPFTLPQPGDATVARSRLPYYLGLGIFLILQILASWYLAIYSGMILAIYLLAAFFAGRIQIPQLARLMATLLIVFSIVLPFALPYLANVDALREARPLSLALSLAATPADFAAAAPFNRIFGPQTESFRTRPTFTEENTLFVGLVAPVLAAISIVSCLKIKISHLAFRSPPPPRRTLSATCLALLTILVISIFLAFPAPYAVLVNLLAPATVIRVPARWIIPALFALAGLAAIGFSVITNRSPTAGSSLQIGGLQPAPRQPQIHKHAIPHLPLSPAIILTVLVTLLLTAESISIPLPLASVENRHTLSPLYAWLTGQSGDIALVELPLHSAPAPEFPEVKRLYASTLGWWQLVNGYSGYTPPRQPELARALVGFPDRTAVAALQALAAQTAPHTSSFFLLVHPGEAPLDRTQWETVDRWQAERNPALLPIGQFEGDYLYQVIRANPRHLSGDDLARFGGDQAISLKAFAVDSPNTNPSNASGLTFYPPRLMLYWQTTVPLRNNYTIFIHLRAADGFVMSQADGLPVSGHYHTTVWQPGELIQDIHPLPPEDFNQVDHLVIGLYDPVTGRRLPAFGPAGDRLGDDAIVVPLH